MADEIKDEKIVEETAADVTEESVEKPVEKKKSSKKAKAEKVEEVAEVVEEPVKEEAPAVVEASKAAKKIEAEVKSFAASKALKLYTRPSTSADYILFVGSANVIKIENEFAQVRCKTAGQGGWYTGFVKVDDIK